MKNLRKSSRFIDQQSIRPEKVIAQELVKQLHDNLGQNLTILGVKLHVLQSRLPADPTISGLINDSIGLLDEIATYIRGLMQGLAPQAQEFKAEERVSKASPRSESGSEANPAEKAPAKS